MTDRTEIDDLLNRYVTNMDRNRHDDGWLPSVFTDDIHLVYPSGEHRGMAEVVAFQQKARNTFTRSQHMSTNHIIECDGDKATATANLTAHHMNEETRFTIGGHYAAEIIRTPVGWRIRHLVFHLEWSTNSPQ